MKGHFWRFVMAFLCLGGDRGRDLGDPLALQHTLDGIFTAKNAELLMPISIIVVVIFFVRGASTYGFTVVMNSIGRRIVAELQMRMFSRKIWDDLASFHATASGHLVSQFIYNVQAVMGAVSTSAASDRARRHHPDRPPGGDVLHGLAAGGWSPRSPSRFRPCR